MPAKNPTEICELFRTYMSQGNVEALLELYDPQAAFLNKAGVIKTGSAGLREELSVLANARAAFEFDIKQIVESDGIALMHTVWTIRSPHESGEMRQYAIEVARRQPDNTWCWLIGDPFTVGKSIPDTRP